MDKINWAQKQNSNQNQTNTHADCDMNITAARNFIKNSEKSILPGMGIRISDSTMNFSFQPPSDYPMGTYGYPISFHQSRNDFSAQMTAAMNHFHKMAKEVQYRLQNRKEMPAKIVEMRLPYAAND